MTIGELKKQIEGYEDRLKINFAKGLILTRIHSWDSESINFEFDPMVYQDTTGKWIVAEPSIPPEGR